MTAVMRAIVRPNGPRVLRLAVVREGRVVEERLVRPGTDVLVGSEASCSVIASCAPHTLFSLRDGRTVLTLGEGMYARVALESGFREIGSGAKLVLEADARGKVLAAGATILFQMVVAPVPAAKPQLPLAVRNGQGIDWNLTMIAALSFLLHFGFVGAMYSDWVDPVVRDAATVGLVDLVKLAPRDVPVEARTEVSSVPSPAAKAPEAAATSRSAGPSPKGASGPSSPSSVSAAKEAAMVAAAEHMKVDILGSMTGAPSTERAMTRGDIPPMDVGEAAAKNTGVAPGSEISTRATGPVATGKPGSLGEIGNTTASRTSDTAGKQRDSQGPSFDTRIERAAPSTPVPDVDRVVAGLRPAFRRCYQNGLTHDASQAGRVVLTARVSPNGEVGSVEVTSNTGLSADVGSCLARALRGAQFTAPGGTGSTLVVPVTFVQNAK